MASNFLVAAALTLFLALPVEAACGGSKGARMRGGYSTMASYQTTVTVRQSSVSGRQGVVYRIFHRRG